MRNLPAELMHDDIDVYGLNGTVLCDSAALGIPTDVALLGSYLAVIDLASDSVLHIIDIESGQIVGQFGRRGEGPGEFKSAWSLATVAHDTSAVWVYDVALRRLTLVDIPLSLQNQRLHAKAMISLQSPGVPTGPLWIDSQTVASLGFYSEGRIRLFDSNGQSVGLIGATPGSASHVEPATMQHVYQGTLVRHPTRGMLAAVTRHASIVEVYGTDGKQVFRTTGPVPFEPMYGIRSRGNGTSMVSGPDLRFGYVDACADSGAIYALFSGRTRAGYPQSSFTGRYVHVFLWDNGRFEMAMKLDADAISIAVDTVSSTLFAVRHNPTPAIVSFPLQLHRRVATTNDPDP